MKKLIAILIMSALTLSVKAAVKYSDAYEVNDTKPMAVLIYADWADNYQNYLSEFRKIQQELGDIYNYVELDLASEDARNYTEQNMILTKLPYIMLYRSKGRFARVLERSCASDASCAAPKMKSFIRQ